MADTKESILLVDDEEAIRFILNQGLEMHGFVCEEASNADQALKKLENRPSDLVIMDINMPGKPGSEALPEITNRFPETAVIMASGITDTSVIAKCIKDGAQDYINKPFKFKQILQSVNTALDKRHLFLEIQQYFNGAKEQASAQSTEPRQIFLNAIQGMINNLESNDLYTKGHSQRVAEISLMIGEKIGLSPAELDDLHWAALLHDVGKIAVDPDILNKPSELTPKEYRHIMTHATIGPSLVKPFVNENVVEIISHHHDHYAGGGFNQSITGSKIPIGSRIIAVADAYHAMISDRPYRSALSKASAIDELQWYSGTQFDPIIANLLIKMVR